MVAFYDFYLNVNGMENKDWERKSDIRRKYERQKDKARKAQCDKVGACRQMISHEHYEVWTNGDSCELLAEAFVAQGSKRP
jgi:hypothetical protein